MKINTYCDIGCTISLFKKSVMENFWKCLCFKHVHSHLAIRGFFSGKLLEILDLAHSFVWNMRKPCSSSESRQVHEERVPSLYFSFFPSELYHFGFLFVLHIPNQNSKKNSIWGITILWFWVKRIWEIQEFL